jgi:hypothetical protein
MGIFCLALHNCLQADFACLEQLLAVLLGVFFGALANKNLA